MHLNLSLAAPSSARSSSCGGSIVALNLVEDIYAEKSAGKPEARRDEREGFSGLPLVAYASTVQPIPVERRAAVDPMNPVDEGSEGTKPCKARNEVDWVVHKAGGEGKEPYQAEKDRPGSDDFRVDLTTKWTSVLLMVHMKKMTDYAENNCGRDELREAEDEGEKS